MKENKIVKRKWGVKKRKMKKKCNEGFIKRERKQQLQQQQQQQ